MKAVGAGAPTRTRILTGNEAAAHGVHLARAQVVSAYPITPQTSIIETLAGLYRDASWPSRFVHVESEHSAMSACIGAAMAGARTFTATSAQGLALMHEVLHWAAGARLPIVLVNVNRAMAPGWSIWTDQNDSLSQRDTGWMQVYCEDNQEVLDTVIHAYRVAETVQLPVMVVLDAFFLSHTAEPVDLPEPETVDRFLPPRRPPFRLDVEAPRAFGGLLGPDVYQEIRYKMHRAMRNALAVWADVERVWTERTGRAYASLMPYRCGGAEVVLVVSGTVAGTARGVVDRLRARGRRVGLLKVRLFRPTPGDSLRRLLTGVPRVAILDRNISFGHHGIFFQEIKSALYGIPEGMRPRLYGYIAGLGGRDVTESTIEEAFERTRSREETVPETIWLGHRP